ncbi:hypothetical protein AZ78_2518 [Lysobacter capsici AZ78]|uniref:Uncharacterized protein n=1 Tax=Lysobacter capsici AZ78 TaxID=1444315 RepID=A0A125MMZ6_9GAMM|nr:hypothetical protein AZ78_2518 [Lysobacter capsici AZ78]
MATRASAGKSESLSIPLAKGEDKHELVVLRREPRGIARSDMTNRQDIIRPFSHFENTAATTSSTPSPACGRGPG